MNNKNCVQYNLSGFQNLTLTDNMPYKIENNKFVDTVQLNDNLTKMILYLKPDVCYSKNEPDIDIFASQILFNLIAKTEVDIATPAWYVDGIFENGKNLLNEQIGFTETLTIFKSINAKRIYDIIVNSSNSIDKHQLIYERIFGILQNPNIIIQFMSLYQILLDNTIHIVGNGKGQRNIADYIKLHEEKYPFISFKESRDPRKKARGELEDTFTYIRNEIGHCEETNDLLAYIHAGNQITNQLIKNMLIVLNDVINEL